VTTHRRRRRFRHEHHRRGNLHSRTDKENAIFQHSDRSGIFL